jgi:GxxExxY protein
MNTVPWIRKLWCLDNHEEHEGNEVNFDPLSHKVIGCALEVHRNLGPGLLESTYEQCLAHELTEAKISFKVQKALPVLYKGVNIDCGYRVDLLIEDKLIVELKSVERMLGVHEAQLLTYMKLSGIKLGLLINFNSKVLKDGLKRFVL